MVTPADLIPELSVEDRIKNLIGNHQAKLAEVRNDPTRTSIHSEATLTLDQIKESLELESIKEVELRQVGDGSGNLVSRTAIQTNDINVFMIHSTKEAQPSFEVTEILYYGTNTGEHKRYQANFLE
ncbi:MAG: hypothetical protein WC851_03290 [Candidatus Shapirobacteria bacterium]|jgi:hypothetical protein